jgi:hypothetical protein
MKLPTKLQILDAARSHPVAYDVLATLFPGVFNHRIRAGECYLICDPTGLIKRRVLVAYSLSNCSFSFIDIDNGITVARNIPFDFCRGEIGTKIMDTTCIIKGPHEIITVKRDEYSEYNNTNQQGGV